MNTFTKFDQLGAALSELSFDYVGLNITRREDGSIWFWCVDLHQTGKHVGYGMGDTPSEALKIALANVAEKQAEAVETKAAEVVA